MPEPKKNHIDLREQATDDILQVLHFEDKAGLWLGTTRICYEAGSSSLIGFSTRFSLVKICKIDRNSRCNVDATPYVGLFEFG